MPSGGGCDGGEGTKLVNQRCRILGPDVGRHARTEHGVGDDHRTADDDLTELRRDRWRTCWIDAATGATARSCPTET